MVILIRFGVLWTPIRTHGYLLNCSILIYYRLHTEFEIIGARKEIDNRIAWKESDEDIALESRLSSFIEHDNQNSHFDYWNIIEKSKK